jgi:Putative beta barrel porin-7 (BBP7)
MTWLAGVRYFRFNDTLSYASSRLDNQFTGANDDIYWDTQLQNDLLGAQLGGIINYCTGRRANLYATTKMGVYGNRSQYDTSIGGIGTAAYVSSTNAFNGQNFVVSSSKTDVAFIGEVGTGVNIRLSSKWSANVGYRAIAASGVATAVDQIPLEMIHLGNVANFDNNGSLILHGLTLGGLYNY